jgi:hypothetical protein
MSEDMVEPFWSMALRAVVVPVPSWSGADVIPCRDEMPRKKTWLTKLILYL